MFPATVRESLDHTARMKLLHTFTLVVLVEFLAGCAAPKARTQTDAPDGFYIEATGTLAGYASEVLPPGGGRALSFRIQDYVGFVPWHVGVFDTPEGYTVQISGRATVEEVVGARHYHCRQPQAVFRVKQVGSGGFEEPSWSIGDDFLGPAHSRRS